MTDTNFGRYGTPVYIAPEVVSDRGYTGFSSDVWSLGVVLYTMLTGSVPFLADTFQKLQKLIMRGKYVMPEFISPLAGDLISKCL